MWAAMPGAGPLRPAVLLLRLLLGKHLNGITVPHSNAQQAMMNRLLQPPEFLLAEQYASAVTTLGLALCWMPVLPVSPLIAALALFLGYWAEKVVALRWVGGDRSWGGCGWVAGHRDSSQG